MDPDRLQQAWQSPAAHLRLSIDADLLLTEVRRNQQHFAAVVFWRDVREVGVGLALVPVWLWMGVQLALPWSWFLMVPVLVWIAGFLLIDRLRHSRRPPDAGQSLRHRLESSLAQVEHQIWLLQNVLWWYLLPPALAMLAFFGHLAWLMRSAGWLAALVTAGLVLVAFLVLAAIYRLNQHAVRTSLQPRRQELLALVAALQDERPAAN
jgi:hypothetical protein